MTDAEPQVHSSMFYVRSGCFLIRDRRRDLYEDIGEQVEKKIQQCYPRCTYKEKQQAEQMLIPEQGIAYTLDRSAFSVLHNHAHCLCPTTFSPFRTTHFSSTLLSLQFLLSHLEGDVKHIALLLQVTRLQSRRHTCAWVSASIHDVPTVVVLGLVQQCLNPRLRETPWTSVKRLFLRPYDCLSVGVRVEIFAELLPWEGIQLLHTGDGGVKELVLLTVFVKCDVYLTSTEDYTLDLIVWDELVLGRFVSWVRNDPLEVSAFGKV